ncbi:MAG: 30S ribosomal protein S17 [Planctomycetes bacterium]|nr:30S ribosomal protein S17 [Planctomycetota bacterium]
MRKRVEGVVKSSKADKTITVLFTDRRIHPLYGKIVNRSTKYYAHDEKNEAVEGDLVVIEETKPLSKTKRWRLVAITRKAQERGA